MAAISVDLVQDAGNRRFFDIPPATAVGSGMEEFNPPDGISNPPTEAAGSGYGGTPFGTAGAKNLYQVGGAQNTFGQEGYTGVGADVIRVFHPEDYPDFQTRLRGVAAMGRTAIHTEYLTGEGWDQWGEIGVALILYMEWQHHEGPGGSGSKDETACQLHMDWLRNQVTEIKDIAPELKHGTIEACD